MNKRKETPDLLSEILGGDIATPAADESLAGPPPTPARPKSASKPRRTSTSSPRIKSQPKWGYRLATFQDHNGWRLRFVDGVAVENWTEGLLMHEYLDQMGGEGWELTGACCGEKLFGHMDKYQLYFKRFK